jgi:hypothetical protein
MSAFLVLDPRLKLAYYQEMNWEKKYIDEASIAISVHYRCEYAPSLEEESQHEDNEEDELVAYIYKRRKIEKVKGDELQSYLRAPCVQPFDKNMTVLTWWKVCMARSYSIAQ